MPSTCAMTRVKLFRKPATDGQTDQTFLAYQTDFDTSSVLHHTENGGQSGIDKVNGANRPSGFVQHVMRFELHKLQVREKRSSFVCGQVQQDFVVDSISIPIRRSRLRAKFRRFTGNHCLRSHELEWSFASPSKLFIGVPIAGIIPKIQESASVEEFCRYHSGHKCVR